MLRPLLLAAGLAATALPAAAIELVVVDARNSALQPGQKLDGNQPLQLEPNARVTLIAANGGTLKLKGPYSEAPAPDVAAQGGDVVDALKQLVTRKESGASTLGAIRSGGPDAEPPQPFLLDVSRAGNRCLLPGAQTVFWRPAAAGQAEMKIQPADGSWAARTNWPAGTDRMAMPASLPLQGGGTYLVEMDGAKSAITLNAVPAALTNDQMRAAWMLEKGCEGQATALARTLVR